MDLVVNRGATSRAPVVHGPRARMSRRPFVWLLAACVAVVVLPMLLIGHARFFSARSRLPERGTVIERAAGLGRDVEVILDARGVPHIYAESAADAVFAQGYLQARDRFFQMELARRRAGGRLAEVFGATALPGDRKMRIWRIATTARQQAVQLAAAEREALEAYAAGVNAAVQRFGRWIAPELWLLGVDPEPWRVEDSLAIGLLQQFMLSSSMGEELRRAEVLARLGRERALDLWGWTPTEARAWIPPLEYATLPAREDDAILAPQGGLGSNCWAVAPRRSATGRPLLANDPHLAVQLPCSWHLVHLHAPGLHVSGASVPGTPGVVIGHTDGVAWGFTMTMLDDQDLFTVTLDDSGSRELVDGRWRPLLTVTERIRVRWEETPELLKVLVSERGPVVRNDAREVLALTWTGREGASPVRAFLAMTRADSVADLVLAWEDVVGPSMNLVAADVRGHILHQVVGLAPDRRRGAGRLPAPGSDSRWSWRGLAPLVGNPHRLDPPEGFISTANHDLFAEGDYPQAQSFPGEFAAPWRNRRIRQLLASREDWDLAGFLELQGDVVSGRAIAVLKALWPDLERHGGAAAAALSEWDGVMDADAVAPYLYSRLLLDLAEEIGRDEADQVGIERSPVQAAEILRLLAGGLSERWWDDVRTPEREDREAVVARALGRMDDLRSFPLWGDVHRLGFEHPLSRMPVMAFLGRSWSRRPFPVGGDGTTVNASYWSRRRPYRVTAIPSLRYVVDVGNWDANVMVLPLGQSGRPWSTHFADQMVAWRGSGREGVPFTREAVEAAAAARMRLVPRAVSGE